jgi:hypothetical protein
MDWRSGVRFPAGKEMYPLENSSTEIALTVAVYSMSIWYCTSNHVAMLISWQALCIVKLALRRIVGTDSRKLRSGGSFSIMTFASSRENLKTASEVLMGKIIGRYFLRNDFVCKIFPPWAQKIRCRRQSTVLSVLTCLLLRGHTRARTGASGMELYLGLRGAEIFKRCGVSKLLRTNVHTNRRSESEIHSFSFGIYRVFHDFRS